MPPSRRIRRSLKYLSAAKRYATEYHCRYDWRTHKVTEIRDGVFYPTRFASPQGALIPLMPQESLVLYRPQTRRRQALKAFSAQQLVLFELLRTG